MAFCDFFEIFLQIWEQNPYREAVVNATILFEIILIKNVSMVTFCLSFVLTAFLHY
jgi:hypothetical protein